MRVPVRLTLGFALLSLLASTLGHAGMNEGPKGDYNSRRPLLRREGTVGQRSGVPYRQGSIGGPPAPGPQVKRVYAPMKYAPPPGQAPLRRQYLPKVRYGPASPSGMRGPPSLAWKSNRVTSPPVNYYGVPPRKVRNPKPHKPFSKTGFSQKPNRPANTKGGYSQQVVMDGFGAPKVVYQVHKVPQTTYGIPHPTQGAPEPPKTAHDSSSGSGPSPSFAHVYQTAHSDDHKQEPKAPYYSASSSSSSSSAKLPETHHTVGYSDETKISSSYNVTAPETGAKTVGFQPPKETYGFQPYDDKDHYSLTPSHSFYSVASQSAIGSSTGQNSLSHNYFDQTS